MLALAIGCENVCFRVLVCARVRQKPCPLCVYIVGVVYVIYVGVCISVRCLCALWCPCLSVIRQSCAFFKGVVCVRSCVPSGNPCTFSVLVCTHSLFMYGLLAFSCTVLAFVYVLMSSCVPSEPSCALYPPRVYLRVLLCACACVCPSGAH